jgi:hypothetical protein
MKVGEKEVEFLGFFAGDEEDGAGKAVGETIHAGSSFAGWGRGSRRTLCILPVSFNLCFCSHMRILLLWRVASRLTGYGFAVLIPRMCRGKNVRQTRESRSDSVISYGLKKTFRGELEVVEGKGNIVRERT